MQVHFNKDTQFAAYVKRVREGHSDSEFMDKDVIPVITRITELPFFMIYIYDR